VQERYLADQPTFDQFHGWRSILSPLRPRPRRRRKKQGQGTCAARKEDCLPLSAERKQKVDSCSACRWTGTLATATEGRESERCDDAPDEDK